MGDEADEPADRVLASENGPGRYPRDVDPALHAFARGPVLAVRHVPEVDRVRRVEVVPGDGLGIEQPLTLDPRCGRPRSGSMRCVIT